MVALVVVESVFGNTRRVAEAIADGLSLSQVDLVDVGHAPPDLDDDIDLVVVGGPTHVFGLTRESTRQDAVRQASGAPFTEGPGLRDWLDHLKAVRGKASPERRPIRAATFDTRVRTRLPGSAAKAAQRRLRRLGFRVVAPAQTFWVQGTTGPLEPGEQDRARAWGERLAALASDRPG